MDRWTEIKIDKLAGRELQATLERRAKTNWPEPPEEQFSNQDRLLRAYEERRRLVRQSRNMFERDDYVDEAMRVQATIHRLEQVVTLDGETRTVADERKHQADRAEFLTLEEIAEQVELSPDTVRRYATGLPDEDKRTRELAPRERRYSWRWDNDGVFDADKYDAPGYREWLRWRDPANRDGDKRMPERSRPIFYQRMADRRDVDPNRRADVRHSSYRPANDQDDKAMLVASPSLYDVDPGLAPRRDAGTRVTEYRWVAVKARLDARGSSSRGKGGRFVKAA